MRGNEALYRSVTEDHPGTYNVAADGVVYLSQAIRILGRLPAPILLPLALPLGSALRRFGLVDFSTDQLRLLVYGRVADNRIFRWAVVVAVTKTAPRPSDAVARDGRSVVHGPVAGSVRTSGRQPRAAERRPSFQGHYTMKRGDTLPGVAERYTVPLDELKRVISGDGPCNAERIACRKAAHEDGAWVREAAMAYAARSEGAA